MKYSRENFIELAKKYLGKAEVDSMLAPGGPGSTSVLDRLAAEIWFKRLPLEKEEDEFIRTAYRSIHFGQFTFNFEE